MQSTSTSSLAPINLRNSNAESRLIRSRRGRSASIDAPVVEWCSFGKAGGGIDDFDFGVASMAGPDVNCRERWLETLLLPQPDRNFYNIVKVKARSSRHLAFERSLALKLGKLCPEAQTSFIRSGFSGGGMQGLQKASRYPSQNLLRASCKLCRRSRLESFRNGHPSLPGTSFERYPLRSLEPIRLRNLIEHYNSFPRSIFTPSYEVHEPPRNTI